MKLTDEQKALLAWKLGPGDANKFLRGENPIPEKKVRATADSWKIKPISDKCGTLVLHMYIRDDNMEILKMGHIPEVMEDHWFIWCDDSTSGYTVAGAENACSRPNTARILTGTGIR